MKHEFHFVINSITKNNINTLSKFLNISISSTIVYIINTLFPMIIKYHNFSNEDSNGNYKIINANTDIHIYIEEKQYRIIKKIHNDMHIFSMAIIIRWMIDEFIMGINKYGFIKFLKIIQRYGKIEKCRVLRIKHWWKYEVFNHMSCSPTQYECYRLSFSEDWTLLGFKLLNC